MDTKEKAYWIYSFLKIFAISCFASAIYLAILFRDKF